MTQPGVGALAQGLAGALGSRCGMPGGDVIAVEPGTVVRSIGGVRVEDLLIVTENGAESLTDAFPLDLTP